MFEYRGYTIHHDYFYFMDSKKVYVYIDGDFTIFPSEEDAKKFIDEYLEIR